MTHSEAHAPVSSDSSMQTAQDAENQGSRVLKIDSTREYLPKPNPLMVAGGWLALVTITTSLLGCWAMPYNTKVKAPALVIPGTAQIESEPSPAVPAAAFLIQAWVPNDRINAIELGQLVQLRINSCPYPTYGILEGRVSHIAADTPAGAIATSEQPLSPPPQQRTFNSYKVLIQPEASSLEATGKKSCELRSGMEGRADILVGQERLLSFLMQKVRL